MPSRTVLLDSGPLGKLAQRTPLPDLAQWYRGVLDAGVRLVVPEVADYEVRREFLRAGMARSFAALDQMKADLACQPITTAAMLHSAELWANARRSGRPTRRNSTAT